MDAILFSNKWLRFDFQGSEFFAAALLSLSATSLLLRRLAVLALLSATALLSLRSLSATALLHNRLRRLCNLLRRLMQLRCGRLSFFAFFNALSFLQLRCCFRDKLTAFADPFLNSFAVFGISSLRSLIPWAPLVDQALSPNSVAVWAFCFKKNLLKLAFQDFF